MTADPALCRTCGGPTQGYKCDVCGAESAVHVESHRCGGPHCMPKCAGCFEAEALCDCEADPDRITAKLNELAESVDTSIDDPWPRLRTRC